MNAQSIIGFLCAASMLAPVSAQVVRPPPRPDPTPSVSLRPFLMVTGERFAADRTFEAVFGRAFQPLWGGGLNVAFRNGFYVDVTASRFRKVGARAFFFEGEGYPLGSPLTATLTPLEVSAGARSRVSPRVFPYFGVGAGSYDYSETSEFDDGPFEKRHVGYLVVLGVEFRISRWIAVSGDGHYTYVSGIIGTGGVSKEVEETNLGGPGRPFPGDHRSVIMRKGLAAFIVVAALSAGLPAQDRLKTMPGYEQFQRVARQIPAAVRSGALAANWTEGGNAVEYTRDGRRYRFDLASRQTLDLEPPDDKQIEGGPRRQLSAGQPERGRQFESALSPDGLSKAFYRNRNLWLSAADGANEQPITTDGSPATRVKYGTASWVYGEELEQQTAMWWSPDSRRIAYYRFDEKQVPDYYVAFNQTRLHATIDAEAYPKAGAANPMVDLFVYDVSTRQSTKIDVRDGRPFEADVVGYYVYHVVWSPDGRELLFFRTNRRQNVMEVAAANPATGACRVILREEWPTGWVNDQPRLVFLGDGRRFIWESQRNGWDNFYLYELSGKLVTPLTTHTAFEVGTLIKVDLAAGVVFYTARDGDNFLKFQLHRVDLDGKGDRRLTDPAYHHSVGSCLTGAGPRIGQPAVAAPCGVSADNRHFIDVYQTHDTPPATRIVDASRGSIVADLARSDLDNFAELGLKKAEMFSYTAADGKTALRGLIQFPSTFDARRKYPVLVNVYGGPEFAVNTARETFVTPSALAEYGFLVLNLDSRAIPGMGKRTLDSIYMRLGQVEVDDMANGVRALWDRAYFDKTRVGIFGASYGGYVAAMALLRHPDVFSAASASSPATDWRNYDTIYTERYMRMPQDNAAGYDAGSLMRYAQALNGRLLLYYGTADNNVHPSNTLQLVEALQRAGKSFDLQVGPDVGHSAVNTDRMMEFFIDNLVLNPKR